MNMIFWCWQSDLDPRVTRNFVRDALAIDDPDAELEDRDEIIDLYRRNIISF